MKNRDKNFKKMFEAGWTYLVGLQAFLIDEFNASQDWNRSDVTLLRLPQDIMLSS